jgi:hypothetical protein
VSTATWAALLAIAVLWPSRLAGPLNGAPLDAPVEAIIIGLALPALVAFDRRILRHPVIRILIVTLLAFKGLSAMTLAQDGWCLRFTSPAPLFLQQERVPHAWDVRADWRATTPQCSAVMDRGYPAIEAFPVWFYNLPPNNLLEPALSSDRPPEVTVELDLSGHLHAAASGVFRIAAVPDVTLIANIDGAVHSQADLDRGIPLAEGSHYVAVSGHLAGERWALAPQWNGAGLWASAAVATMAPAGGVDRLARPWARWLAFAWLAGIVGWSAALVLRRVGGVATMVSGASAAFTALAGFVGGGPALRLAPIALALSALVRVPRRVQNLHGAAVLIGVPFLILFAIRGAGEAGVVTWYTSGDDWWMFQRFAYRIFMEGYWLEGGEPTFWFQPLYRWIAGALHMAFGDSSVGELFWDAGCALIGGLFAFQVTRTIAGFRWGIAAAAISLLLLTAGPGWYLFGRGLSELTSAGFIYAAALFALRARGGAWRFIALSGICVALAFYSRLNNLPMAIAIASFALPVRYPIGHWTRVREWWPRVSWRVAIGVAAALVLAMAAFVWRTHHYTGEWSLLYGTQASARSVWQPTGDGESTLQNVAGSVLMVLTMSDPARLDPRALPIVLGTVAAIAGFLGAPVFRQLPLNTVMLCLAGFVGSFVARGSAYPGRFSVHLVPATVTLAVCAVALVAGRRASREAGTTDAG